MPHNLEAERGVLGSIMLFNECFHDVADTLRPDHFYNDANQQIYRAILSIRETGAFDVVTIAKAMDKAGRLQECGGPSYLEEVLGSVPHAAHAKHYAGIVTEQAWRRAIIAAGHTAIQGAFDATVEVDELITEAEGTLHSVLEDRLGSVSTTVTMQDALIAAMDSLNSEEPPGTPTGFQQLDDLIIGLRPQNQIIIAARPSVGKTSFMGNLCWQIAKQNHPVLIFSLEQSTLELAARLLSSASGVSMAQMSRKDLSDDDRDKILRAAGELSELPIFIDDKPRNVSQIMAVTRLFRRKRNVAAVFIDYLQLIEPEDRRAPREQQVSDASKALKNMAKSLNIPVVALAQLNREIEKRDDKRPRLSDLRESGAVEQNADVILFLDRPSLYDDQADDRQAFLYLKKQRNGPQGTVELHFDKETMTFSGLEKVIEPTGGFGFSDESRLDGEMNYGQYDL